MPQKRRIFIAINLPDGLKKKIFELCQKWDFLFARQSFKAAGLNRGSVGEGGAVRWTKKDSLHLTLVFIGYVDEEEMYEVCRLTKEIAQKNEPFDINFERILYGPPYKTPRMIWFEGKASKDLSELKHKLDEALLSLETLRSFRPERRPFSPHITLARLRGQYNNLTELPQIEQELKVEVAVSSIDVMESNLKGDGAEYVILESCPLMGE